MASDVISRVAIPKELTDKFPWRSIFITFGISLTCWFFVALAGCVALVHESAEPIDEIS